MGFFIVENSGFVFWLFPLFLDYMVYATNYRNLHPFIDQ